MLKKLLSPLMMLTLLLTLTTPKKSEAVIGMMASSVGFTVLAAATAGSAIYTGVAIAVKQGQRDHLFVGILLGAVVAAAGSYLGLVFLDEDQTVELAMMSASDASKLGVTMSERQAFNSELEEANFVFEDIKQNAQGLSQVEVAQMWEDYSTVLSAKTFSTIQKISHSLK